MDLYQQFIIRAVDDLGDSIKDFHVEFYTGDGTKTIREFAEDVHPFADDRSYRCFHINLSKLQPDKYSTLFAKIIASSGTRFIGITDLEALRRLPNPQSSTQGVNGMP
jgi:hypothetical protein